MLCVRPGECRQLKFEYFDKFIKTLTIPGSVMKIKRNSSFRIPLTAYTDKLFDLAVQEIRFDNQKYLFPKVRTDDPLGEMRFAEPWKIHVGELAHMHGFRKSARSWMSEHEIPVEVAAKCLDHTLNLGADLFYQKSDLFEQRKVVMEQWNQAVYDNLPPSFKKFFS